MAMIKVKGHEFVLVNVRDSANRKSLQFKNNIIQSLRKLGVKEDQIEIPLENSALRKVPAFAEWYMDGHYMYYDYKLANNYAENLFVVSKLIELEVKAVLSEEKSEADFVMFFKEEKDVHDKRKAARELLGLEQDTTDLDAINVKYKTLAKEHHPDKEGGNVDKFKEINNAHKILKRELE
ncbi:MAG: DnaJ domain-containing protein [Candidatus Diapherotrites archaeon]|nr:DnaJ domain-containing protein [Candidatus Diapherotrites archaeon]